MKTMTAILYVTLLNLVMLVFIYIPLPLNSTWSVYSLTYIHMSLYVHWCEDIIAEGLSLGKKGVTDMYYGIWSFGVTFLYIKQFMTSIFIKI